MSKKAKLNRKPNVCAIDVGSPKRGNIGWCFIDFKKGVEKTGKKLDELIPLIGEATKKSSLMLGLEAPLIIPVRHEELRLTSGRHGDGNRPWSGSSGAVVAAINIPIMVYLFRSIHQHNKNVTFFVNKKGFEAKPNQIMIFEAFVSGKDKQPDHIGDAKYMARSCAFYTKTREYPPTILEHEDWIEYLNLAGTALIRSGLKKDIKYLNRTTPIYKPTSEVLKTLKKPYDFD